MPRPALFLAALAALTVAAYWQVGACGFVAFDDPAYVSANPMVNQGLREAAFYWAFTASHGGNWHPLTSLSHMADVSLFDVNAAAHHGMNVAWHTLNAALVFVVWRRFTGATGRAWMVAALFALHPLHVESVAWISERKDVLSTALWLATLLAYARYVERSTRARYSLVVLGLALGLMAKPMVVTLPFTLLLLDYWPLRRWPARGWGALLWEKIPLFALAAASSAVTLYFQHEAGAGEASAGFSLAMRAGNAAVSCARYLGKTFWPAALSPFYPHPGAWPWWAVLGAVGLLGAVSGCAWRERVRRRWLLFGWCWFLGTLVPVLGWVQVGPQAMADRYTYVPLLGIFTAVVWAGAECGRWRAPLAALALALCFLRTVPQVGVWESSTSVARRMHAVAGEHPYVYRELCVAATHAGRPPSEIDALYRRGLAAAPDDAYLLLNLAMSAERAGRTEEARALFEKTRASAPRHPALPTALGVLAIEHQRFEEAIAQLTRARELGPRNGYTHRLIAEAFARSSRFPEARDSLLAAIRCDRWDWQAHAQLGVVYAALDRPREALESTARAHWMNPADRSVAENYSRMRVR